MRVKKSKECGNSPKNELAQDIVIALFKGDRDFLGKVVGNGFEWQISTSKVITNVGSTPPEVNGATAIEVDLSITHGKSGSVSGVLKTKDSKKQFSVILEFTSASAKKVQRAINYWVK